jgi:hypothetical protein
LTAAAIPIPEAAPQGAGGSSGSPGPIVRPAPDDVAVPAWTVAAVAPDAELGLPADAHEAHASAASATPEAHLLMIL